MEANRKRRGFIKGKQLVMSFYRTANPSSTVQFSSNKVKPTPSSASVGFGRVDQDFSIPTPPKQKLSFTQPDSFRDSNGHFNTLHGGGGDENVDMKTATYISYVQERFRHEQAS